MQPIKVSAKVLSLFAAAGAVAVMGVATMAGGASTTSGSTTVVAAGGESTQGTAPSTPAVPSAEPTLKASKFTGGDWTGM